MIFPRCETRPGLDSGTMVRLHMLSGGHHTVNPIPQGKRAGEAFFIGRAEVNQRTHFVCIVEGCGQPHDAKGYCHAHYNKWKRTGDPLTPNVLNPDGTGWIADGYRYFTVDGKKKREHQIVVEKVLGRTLPRCVIIHHVDENRLNNSNENLVVCPNHKYHHLLHQRMRALDACGNANWRKCAYCHQYDDSANMREEQSGRCVHARCSADAQIKSKRARFGDPETVQSRAIAACGHADWRKCWICKTYSDPATMRELRRADGTGYFYHAECSKQRGAENYKKRKARDVHV